MKNIIEAMKSFGLFTKCTYFLWIVSEEEDLTFSERGPDNIDI